VTDPESKFDAELAWDIQEFNEQGVPGSPDLEKMHRSEVKALAKFLTSKGYAKSTKGGGLSDIFDKVESLGGILVDEFGPIAEALRKRK
jgi:hypothetical protein